MADEPEQQAEQIPDFNFALLFLTHLHNLVCSTSQYIMNKDAENLLSVLRALYLEVSFYFTNENKDKVKKYFVDIENLLYDAAVVRYRAGPMTAPPETQNKYKTNTAEALNKLYDCQEFILSLMFKSGLIMPHTKNRKGVEGFLKGVVKNAAYNK
jgi:hypothetical protein